jgi:hypothetical protein
VHGLQIIEQFKNVVFLDVTPYSSRKNLCFGGTYRLHHQAGKDQRDRSDVSSN